jgi:hypothetical protein
MAKPQAAECPERRQAPSGSALGLSEQGFAVAVAALLLQAAALLLGLIAP